MTNNTRSDKLRSFFLIFIYLFIQLVLFFNYSFFSVGWHEKLARYFLIILSIIAVTGYFISVKSSTSTLFRILLIFNWAVLGIALVCSVFKPYVLSTDNFDLYLTQAVYILNPGISFSYLFFISSSLILIRHLKKFKFKPILLIIMPIFIWIMLRIVYLNVNTPIFQG